MFDKKLIASVDIDGVVIEVASHSDGIQSIKVGDEEEGLYLSECETNLLIAALVAAMNYKEY